MIVRVVCRHEAERRDGNVVKILRYQVPENSGELELLCEMLKKFRIKFKVKSGKKGKR